MARRPPPATQLAKPNRLINAAKRGSSRTGSDRGFTFSAMAPKPRSTHMRSNASNAASKSPTPTCASGEGRGPQCTRPRGDDAPDVRGWCHSNDRERDSRDRGPHRGQGRHRRARSNRRYRSGSRRTIWQCGGDHGIESRTAANALTVSVARNHQVRTTSRSEFDSPTKVQAVD